MKLKRDCNIIRKQSNKTEGAVSQNLTISQGMSKDVYRCVTWTTEALINKTIFIYYYTVDIYVFVWNLYYRCEKIHKYVEHGKRCEMYNMEHWREFLLDKVIFIYSRTTNFYAFMWNL